MNKVDNLDSASIEAIVIDAIRLTNQARLPDQRLEESSTALLYAPQSPLDSLGLVALLIEVEEGLAEAGHPVTLSSERAMSQRQNPFRDVPSLVGYISSLLQANAP
jgi:hypothetical protein